MALLVELTPKLAARQNLTPEEVALAAAALAATEEPDDIKGAFLTALALKGETASEIAAFAKAFRARAIDPGVGPWSPRAIDIVGTGGDHAGGFNISSLVVLVLACAGVPVMKHGNRGITSKCGSADLLAALGVDLAASPEKLRAALDKLGYVFFFAPNYHPSFKHIGPVRKALAAQGQRTVFNILGPLINPGRPAHILLGVYSQPLVEKLASALDELGQEAGLVGHGIISATQGIDELTTATDNYVRGVGRLRDVRATWRATDFGLKISPFSELQGGDVTANLAIVEAILTGKGPGGLVDTIVFNAAVGLHVTGHTPEIRAGIETARQLLLGGAVRAKITATKEFYLS
ncbi:anthranilate phosphoribosyltransferase [Oleiharenicola lentus]|uniref:anthranilate phosphoribosyltransferase n=1 Tax=Oleiharenicola lentus TaxID=2508720 RepID=UPI003F67E841